MLLPNICNIVFPYNLVKTNSKLLNGHYFFYILICVPFFYSFCIMWELFLLSVYIWSFVLVKFSVIIWLNVTHWLTFNGHKNVHGHWLACPFIRLASRYKRQWKILSFQKPSFLGLIGMVTSTQNCCSFFFSSRWPLHTGICRIPKINQGH